jgi:GrpB-like predicted nucleotidyltransferase (UPF0157 family)
MADSEFDRHLEATLVGGFEPRRVIIADYDPGWPLRFESERDRLVTTLGSVITRIEHIGSTAVPGLAAKPVVDIIVTVADITNDDAFQPAIEGLGYELRVLEPEHRAFRTVERDVNLHVWGDSDPEVERHLVFRDHLRRAPDDRALYERTKRELATRHWRDINYYADAKSTVVAEIMERAERGERGSRGGESNP